jgi:hypothetical protein
LSTRRRFRVVALLVSVGIAAGVLAVDSGAAIGDFASGFEQGDPGPDWRAGPGVTVMKSTPRAEVAHSGTYALKYSGTDLGPAGSFSSNQVFDVDLALPFGGDQTCTVQTIGGLWFSHRTAPGPV